MNEKALPEVNLVFTESQFDFGSVLSLEAVVTGSRGVATGLIVFQFGGMVMGNIELKEGIARLKYTGFLPGTHPVKAVYSGDENYLTTESASQPFAAVKPNYTPAVLPNTFPQPQKGGIPISKPQKPTKFRVNLAATNDGILPADKEIINYLALSRTINIPGVGNNLKHGYEFSLVGEAAARIKVSYADFIQEI